MSVRVMAMVWAAPLGGASLKLVMLKLADVAAEDGTRVYPSIQRIASETALSERTVQTAMRELREAGLITLIREGGGKYANEYRINIDVLEGFDPRNGCTGATAAPVQSSHPSGAMAAPPPVQPLHPPGAMAAPYPSYNHQSNHHSPSARAWFVEFAEHYPKPADGNAAWSEFAKAVTKGCAPELLVQVAKEIARQVSDGEQEIRWLPRADKFLRQGDYRPYLKLLEQQDKANAQSLAAKARLEPWTLKVQVDQAVRQTMLCGVRFDGRKGDIGVLTATTKVQRDYISQNIAHEVRSALGVKQLEVNLGAE